MTDAESLPSFFYAKTLLLSTFVCLVVLNLSVCLSGWLLVGTYRQAKSLLYAYGIASS